MWMSKKNRLKAAAKMENIPYSVTAPISGWNARDALDEMEPTDAVTLDNWYPDNMGVFVRNGYTPFASGVGSVPVRTLAEFQAGGTRKFIAAASGNFYDISAGGVAGAPLKTGFSGDAWQTVHFKSLMYFANGLDNMQAYDGATFTDAPFTGVAMNTLVGGIIYQQRLFFWQNNSTGFWFAPLQSISGALQFFDLQAFSPNGGNIVTAVTYSHDGGNGVVDFIVFMMSSGDALIYFGNDPSNPNFWTLVGIYRISPPVNIRAVCQYGAEAFLTTFDDHIPLQQQLVALKLGNLPPRSKVNGAVKAAVAANPNGFGWQALFYPQGRRLIFNIPNPDGTFSQHVQNTSHPSQPWCRFINMPSFTWGLFRNNLFFGSAGGIVYQADNGNLDNMGAVQAKAQQAWNMFEKPIKKRVTLARPVVQASSPQSYQFALGYDYGDINVNVIATTGGVGSPWDTSPWDTSPWSPENIVDPHWRVGGGTGQAVGVLLTAAANQQIIWLRTDYRYTDTVGL